jgi:cadmium resistance protein CadD (predicted permease)
MRGKMSEQETGTKVAATLDNDQQRPRKLQMILYTMAWVYLGAGSLAVMATLLLFVLDGQIFPQIVLGGLLLLLLGIHASVVAETQKSTYHQLETLRQQIMTHTGKPKQTISR